jgi:hypothetical protein
MLQWPVTGQISSVSGIAWSRSIVDLLRATLEAQTAKEGVVRLEGELRALQSRPWWRRLVG